jgi:hypothetical protein
MIGDPPDDRGSTHPPSGDDARPETRKPQAREAELIAFPGQTTGSESPTGHLLANRSLIVRRSLLATAVGGVVPVPVMDDYLAGRVRAGMLVRIADRRRVDLLPSSAELLADPREGTAARNATMTAATLLALKLAWRKFFILLGAGRRAEEMATTFQVGTLFDHFCAKTHVGAGVDRQTAMRLRGVIFASIRETERSKIVGVFQEGGRLLGKTIGEAPSWVSRRLQRVVEQYVASGGNPEAIPVDPAESPGADPTESRWLDKAASLVEERLASLGNGYLAALLVRFDHHWSQDPGTSAAPSESPHSPQSIG